MNSSTTQFLTHQNAAVLNRNAILNFIKNNAPVSRTDIWEKMHLSRASVTQIIKQLIEQGYVYETGTGESRGGRKPCYLEFNGSARNMLAFDWHLKTIFLTDLKSEILYKKTVNVSNKANADDFVDALSQAINEVTKSQKLDFEKILGLGLIMPGIIDAENGFVILSAEQNWENVDLLERIEKSTGLSTILEQDGHMQALGEYMNGISPDNKNFVLLSVEDDGIGSAIILNGDLQRGSYNMSGEVGHIVINEKGPLCACGKNGCLEAYIKETVKKKSNSWKGETARYIGKAASILIDILDPSILILTGNLIDKGGDEFISQIKEAIFGQILKAENRDIKIYKSTIGSNLRITGICSLIYNMNFNEVKKK